jgi:hypothetical protein
MNNAYLILASVVGVLLLFGVLVLALVLRTNRIRGAISQEHLTVESQSKLGLGVAYGLCIGCAVGVGVGLAMRNPAIGIALGVGVGMALGAAFGVALDQGKK